MARIRPVKLGPNDFQIVPSFLDGCFKFGVFGIRHQITSFKQQLHGRSIISRQAFVFITEANVLSKVHRLDHTHLGVTVVPGKSLDRASLDHKTT